MTSSSFEPSFPPEFDVHLLTRRDVSYHDNAGFDLTIEHLRADRDYVVDRCRITEQDDFKLVRTVIPAGASVRLTEDLPPPGVELVTVRELAPGQAPEQPKSSHCDAQ